MVSVLPDRDGRVGRGVAACATRAASGDADHRTQQDSDMEDAGQRETGAH